MPVAVPGPMPAPGGAAAAASAGGFKPGSKLKIKFKPAAAAAAAATEPPADRSSQVQGDHMGQLQQQPSLPSQLTGATTGQSQQRAPGVKTKIKFTLPKGPRPQPAAASGAAPGPGSAAAAGAAMHAGTPAAAGAGAALQRPAAGFQQV